MTRRDMFLAAFSPQPRLPVVRTTYQLRNVFTNSSTQYTLSKPPNGWPVCVYMNGILLNPNEDYTLAGQKITFQIAPGIGVRLQAIYWTEE
jgi:hypothetical protein